MGWQEAADLVVKVLEQSFEASRATYDLARFMENSVQLTTTDFGDELVKRIKDL